MTVPNLFPGTFITHVWEGKLLVRRRAVESRLAKAREQHSKFVEWRAKYTPDSNAWQQYDVLVRTEREKIALALDEIEYVKGLSFAGPIVGGHMHVPGENGYQGPSIIDLFNRVAEHYESDESETSALVTEEFATAKGIRLGLEILTNPYKFLNSEEREAYDLASKVTEMATEEQLERVAGHGSPRSGPPKRGPGRPRGSRNKPKHQSNEVKDLGSQRITLFRMTDSGGIEKA